MSEDYSHAEGEELDILLEMYQQLREEVRAHGKRKSRRYLGSLTVLGVIIGYLFTTNGGARVLVLVPFVLGFLYLSHISSMNYVVQLAALLALIEAKISYLGAEYEWYHGGFSISANPRFTGIDVSADVSQDNQTTVISSVRRRVQKFALHRTAGKQPTLEVIQDTVQSHVHDGMHILAIISYLGAAILGTVVLATHGIPELGIGEYLATLTSIVIFVIQIGLLVQIISAWSAYQQHRAVLSAGVEDAVEQDDFDQGLRARDPSIGSE